MLKEAFTGNEVEGEPEAGGTVTVEVVGAVTLGDALGRLAKVGMPLIEGGLELGLLEFANGMEWLILVKLASPLVDGDAEIGGD